jgi:hypothetical protein
MYRLVEVGVRNLLNIDKGRKPNYNSLLLNKREVIMNANEIESMICKNHGYIEGDQVSKEKNNKLILGYQLRCSQCRRDKDRKYKLNNPDKHAKTANQARNEARKLYREGLSDVEPNANILARGYRKNNPEKFKEQEKLRRKKEGQLRNTKEVCRRLDMEVSDYYIMLESQNGLCKICNKEETRKSRTEGKICQLAIDHCHTTGKIRGLLCHACNIAIGKFKDDINLLEKAIQYLKAHEHSEG